MTHVDLRIVNQHRSIVASVIRILGLWLLITRPFQVINQAIVILWQTYVVPVTGMRTGFVYEQPWMIVNLIQGALYLAAGIWMLVKARRIAAWMVPIPKPSCPGCRYDLISSNARSCPECGLDLSSLQSPAPDSQPRAE